MARKLIVEIVGDTRGLEKSYQKAGAQTKKFGGALAGVGKAAALTAGGIGLGGLLVVAKRGFDEFSAGQKVSAQTAAALKSTGGAARVTAKQISGLAQAISNYSGIDDEAIQAGENLLLTFTNIRNEVGKGNDIFNQATKTITNMSVALGQDIKVSAIQLGKALNDPVKGITALTRVGVTFTEQQKQMIKGLSGTGDAIKDLDTVGVHLSGKQKNLIKDMGDTTDAFKAARLAGIQLTDAQLNQLTVMSDGTGVIKAQKIILGELNKEFGNSAKAAGSTLSGSLNRLRNAFDNLAGTIVASAAPAIQRLTDRLATWLQNSKNQERVQRDVEAVVKAVAGAVKTLKEIIDAMLPVIRTLVGLLGGWKNAIIAIIALKFAHVISRWTRSMGLFSAATTTAAGKTRGLATLLRSLPAVIPITIALEILINRKAIDKAVTGFLNKHGLGAFTGVDNLKTWADWVKVPAGIKKQLLAQGFDPSTLPGAPKPAGSTRRGGPTVPGGGRAPATRAPAGTRVPGVAPVLAGASVVNAGMNINGPITVNGVQDPDDFLKKLQKKAQRSAPSRAGRFGGHNLGLA